MNRDPPFCIDSYGNVRSTSDHPIPSVLAVHAFIPKSVCGYPSPIEWDISVEWSPSWGPSMGRAYGE